MFTGKIRWIWCQDGWWTRPYFQGWITSVVLWVVFLGRSSPVVTMTSNTDKEISRSSAAFCVRFSKHHNKLRAELGIGGRGIEVCCRPTHEIIEKLCESSAHRHEESDSIMPRRGCYMATQNVRIPAGLLPRLTYDKLQLSCPELPSRCVTQAHLASAVGCDISPPAKKILLLCLKTPPGALSLCSLNLLTQNGFWNCWSDQEGVIEFQ